MEVKSWIFKFSNIHKIKGRMMAPRIALAKKGEKGASMLEYALLAALIAVVCIVAITTIGKNASLKFSSVASSM